MSWVHTRAKSRLSWQNYVQEVVCKKADRKYATPDVAERPSKAIIMMVVRTGKMKINFFKKDPQAVSGGTGTT